MKFQYQATPPIVRDKASVEPQCDQFGNLKVAIGGVVTINGGDASAANQVLLNTAIGTPNTPVATTDTGVWSLIALIKRLLTRVPVFGLTQSAGTIVNGTILAANTAQVALAANANRVSIEIQNNSEFVLWVNYGGTANINAGFQLHPDQTWVNPASFCPTGAISIWGSNAGQQYAIAEG